MMLFIDNGEGNKCYDSCDGSRNHIGVKSYIRPERASVERFLRLKAVVV